jgi:hypothetical protein
VARVTAEPSATLQLIEVGPAECAESKARPAGILKPPKTPRLVDARRSLGNPTRDRIWDGLPIGSWSFTKRASRRSDESRIRTRLERNRKIRKRRRKQAFGLGLGWKLREAVLTAVADWTAIAKVTGRFAAAFHLAGFRQLPRRSRMSDNSCQLSSGAVYPHSESAVGPQSWHHDGCPPGVFRGVLYLCDVDRDTGPFQYKDDKGTLGKTGDLLVFDACGWSIGLLCPRHICERPLIWSSCRDCLDRNSGSMWLD